MAALTNMYIATRQTPTLRNSESWLKIDKFYSMS
ncbi:uncharacterized protein LW94_12257 [Fusarium fujikuroi]|nr:uncharacterized protein LW93_6678 [Fusarium fujikuroi]KLP07785.1 uncharacterized protein Y057_10928 [Fusarium fujikuroi]KLP15106.1 uncharacterized protein LW94_12257 [Fusarium fujikuroi]